MFKNEPSSAVDGLVFLEVYAPEAGKEDTAQAFDSKMGDCGGSGGAVEGSLGRAGLGECGGSDLPEDLSGGDPSGFHLVLRRTSSRNSNVVGASSLNDKQKRVVTPPARPKLAPIGTVTSHMSPLLLNDPTRDLLLPTQIGLEVAVCRKSDDECKSNSATDRLASQLQEQSGFSLFSHPIVLVKKAAGHLDLASSAK